jgi:multidrug efflux pump subunit AcrA (membrane-fusion protein)
MSRNAWRIAGGLASASIVVGIVVAVHAVGRSGQSESPPRSSPEAATVHLVRPQKRTIVHVVEQPSFVESYEHTSIYPKMTAYIEQWHVDIGDRVKKGQVLARLFVPELVEDFGTKKATVQLDERRVELARKLVQVAAAEVDAATAKLAEARANLGRYQAEVDRWNSEVARLGREVAQGVVDPQVLLESKNQLKSNIADKDSALATISKAEADLVAKKAMLEQNQIAVDVAGADLDVARSEARRLQALVGYLVLSAPFDGIITGRNANTFDFVLPASGDPSTDTHAPHLSPSGSAAPIYVVERTDVVRVFVDVPEQQANYISPGSKATVLIEGYSSDPISANVTRTSWALNVRSRTLRAEIDLPNGRGRIVPDDIPEAVQKSLAEVKLPETTGEILPGMYAYGNVFVERQGIWALPKSVIDYRNGKSFYWTCGKRGAERIEVRTGISDNDWVEIVRSRPAESRGQPWTRGDRPLPAIVANDVLGLADGAPVKVAAEDETSAKPVAAEVD